MQIRKGYSHFLRFPHSLPDGRNVAPRFDFCKGLHNSFNIFLCQLIVVRDPDALARSINKQSFVVGFPFSSRNHNAGSNGSSEEQIARKLD